MRIPRWAQSIRFRLALAYSLAVFATGTVLLLALFGWQWRQLKDPVTPERRPLYTTDLRTGELVDSGFRVFTQDAYMDAYLGEFERLTNARALAELRKASLAGLGVLFLISFGSGWLLAAWTLRPMGQMAAVARETSASDLSARIGLRGPDDELKDLADTFDEMLDRLQASFEAQRAFVQDASHELRNPLAIASTNLELVLDDPHATTEQLRAAAEIAQASNGRLAAIVDDLIVQARDRVPRSRGSEVDLGTLAERVADELRASASARGLVIDVAIGDNRGHERAVGVDAGDAFVELNGNGTGTGTGGAIGTSAPVGLSAPIVSGDESAIHRAVTNLAVNAVRLAPVGSTVTIRAGTDGTCATIAVSDEGPGIAAENHEAVFDRFWRGDEAGKGLGLGLSIVRQVAERHGGSVQLVSAPGSGSTFTIELPMRIERDDRLSRGFPPGS